MTKGVNPENFPHLSLVTPYQLQSLLFFFFFPSLEVDVEVQAFASEFLGFLFTSEHQNVLDNQLHRVGAVFDNRLVIDDLM